jgi:hypothetical protein
MVGVPRTVATTRGAYVKGARRMKETIRQGAGSLHGPQPVDPASVASASIPSWGQRRRSRPSDTALERTAGSHSLAAAAHRDRLADSEGSW